MTDEGVIFEVGIIGCGAMGASAAWHLSKSAKVIAWEKESVPNNLGSSHGHSRIIRLAYMEDAGYVVLAKEAYQQWRELERLSGRKLLHITGGLDIGTQDSEIFKGSLESCKLHSLNHQVLDSQEINDRFPGFALPDGFKGVFQPEGGFLDPEACICAFVELALQNGAAIHGREEVSTWTQDADGLFTVTTNRSKYRVRKLLVTAGAWTQSLVGKFLPTVVSVERQVLGWFSTKPGCARDFHSSRFPIFILDDNEGKMFYGFPEYKVPGVKIGLFGHFHENVSINNGERSRPPDEKDESALKSCFSRFCPNAAGPVLSMETCMFCNSVDHHFIIDELSPGSNIFIAAGFSGHGFKFASAIGGILYKLVSREPLTDTPHDKFALEKFSLARFTVGTSEERLPNFFKAKKPSKL